MRNQPFSDDLVVVDGKPRSKYDSNGLELGSSCAELEDFWRWFGDSVTVDEEGRPFLVWHGTNSAFDSFDPNRFGSNFECSCGGIFFSSCSEVARSYAVDAGQHAGGEATLMGAYIRLEAPHVSACLGDPDRYFDLHADALMDTYDDYCDGFVVAGVGMAGQRQQTFVVFGPD